MSFQIPNYLKSYLESTKYRKPFENFVNNSTYYAQLNWQWINYMQTVVRPCVAYGTGSVDGVYNQALSTSTGMSIVRGATRLITGDKPFFNGNDESCRFLSDIWAPSMNFNRFVAQAVSFMLSGGTSVIKINTDSRGRNYLSAFRIDRTLLATDESGEITDVAFFISLFTNTKNDNQSTYWLVEERKFNDRGQPVIIYKVFQRDGVANSPTLPSPFQNGIDIRYVPKNIRQELSRLRITELNREIPLPYGDGLGAWLMTRTATNSCVPDSPFGDPLLYGALDLLWSIDVVFSGSLVDVLNGEGKILVPKQFLQDTLNRLQQQYPGTEFNVTTAELRGYEDESFVYVMPSMFDKDKMSPTPVQFEIRADQYGKMLEIYERMAAVRAGFSPTSIFPYLTPDNSAKTAREVTAEENLTRASVREAHNLILPVFSRALREVLRQEGFSTDVELQLGDYIGNKLEFDENIRMNYNTGLIPQEIAVKSISNLTDSETQEYLEKINAEKDLFNDSVYPTEHTGDSGGGSGSGNPFADKNGVL